MSQLKSESYQWKSISDFNEYFNLHQYVRNNFPVSQNSTGSYLLIPCPFHNESTASCAIYTNSYYCFGAGCGAHGDSLDFVAKVTGQSIQDVLRNGDLANIVMSQSAQQKKKAEKINFPHVDIMKFYNTTLMLNENKMQYLYNRHFNKMAISRANIGYNEHMREFRKFVYPRYSIPVYDDDGNLISARYRIDPVYEEQSNEPKYLGHPQAPTYLYNAHLLKHHKNIVLVGSEFDAAFLLHRYGIHAIAPPGEGNFKEEWIEKFVDKNVLIWYDKDSAGVAASIKTYNLIRHVANAQIYKWSADFKNKDDVCDFVSARGIISVFQVLDEYNVKAYH